MSGSVPTTADHATWRLVFLQSRSFHPYADYVELHVFVTGRKKRGAISRYGKAGWGLHRAERLKSDQGTIGAE